jgi:hypothetical protein
MVILDQSVYFLMAVHPEWQVESKGDLNPLCFAVEFIVETGHVLSQQTPRGTPQINNSSIQVRCELL